MSDLINEALENNEYEQERSASGIIDGTQVEVRKKSYRTKLQEEEWKVAVYLHGNDYHEEQKAGLTAEEAEERFNALVDKHSLRDENESVKSLDELEEIDQDTLDKLKEEQDDEPEDMWCRECATKAKYGPGIGHYCPNQDCEVGDGPELVDSKSKAKDQDIGREVSAEDCDECGGTLTKTGSTVHATGFADSFEAECVDCGHTQHVPAW